MLGSAAATATTRGGEKSNLLHEGFPKLGAPLIVVLVCFAQGIDTYLSGEKLLTSTSTSNIILIDVLFIFKLGAPSIFTNEHK